MINKALFSSNSDEWATPQELYNELNAEFNFNLDACATDDNHKAPTYFTKAEDGLKQEWGGIDCLLTRLIVILALGLKRLTMSPLSLTR